MYHSLQACHWNIKGDLFFDLHSVYGEHYDQLGGMIDELAERIVGLHGHPISNQAEAIRMSFVDHIELNTDAANGYTNNSLLEKYFSMLSEIITTFTAQALQSNDYATAHILMDQSAEIEKLVWKYRSFNGSR